MRKLLFTIAVSSLVLASQATPARADFGLGLFLGQPSGIDFKIGLNGRAALDLLLGYVELDDDSRGYGHVTYLVTPFVASGDSVLVPLRLGIGASLFGPSDHLGFSIRAPLELGIRLRRTPLEFYGEIALNLVLHDYFRDEVFLDIQGGVGFRVYF